MRSSLLLPISISCCRRAVDKLSFCRVQRFLRWFARFAGREQVLAAYSTFASKAGYRFYSYGDCMLIRSR